MARIAALIDKYKDALPTPTALLETPIEDAEFIEVEDDQSR